MEHQSKIHCDHCHDEFYGLVPDFHNKACAKCGHSPLISDQDMEVIKLMDAMVDSGLATYDTTDPRVRAVVKVDTAVLRNNTNL